MKNSVSSVPIGTVLVDTFQPEVVIENLPDDYEVVIENLPDDYEVVIENLPDDSLMTIMLISKKITP